MRKITVAIDGFSSSGKSTMARALARRVGYVYVDSGAMYRAVTLFALRNGLIEDGKVNRDELVNALDDIHISFAPAGADGVQHTLLNGEDVEREIRDMKVSSMVSPVAEIPEVRRRLTAIQKEFGLHKGIVIPTGISCFGSWRRKGRRRTSTRCIRTYGSVTISTLRARCRRCAGPTMPWSSTTAR